VWPVNGLAIKLTIFSSSLKVVLHSNLIVQTQYTVLIITIQLFNGHIMTSLLASIALLMWGLACAIQDIQKKRISNTLILTLFLVALAYLLSTGNTLLHFSAEQAVLGLIYAVALSLPGYMLGRMGAADVKMLSTIAIATSSTYVLICFIGAAVSVAIWVTVKPLWLKLPSAVKDALPLMDPTTGKSLPYAPFLWIGMLLATV